MGAKQSETEIFVRNIQFQEEITKDSYSNYFTIGSFIIINSIDKVSVLIYSTEKNSIIFMNFVDFQKIHEIQKAHNKPVTILKHHLEKNNEEERDLLLSISCEDSNAKIWNIKNYECILSIENIYPNDILHSGCFLISNEKIHFVTCHYKITNDPQPVKVFDLYGNLVREIKDSYIKTYYIDNYYDKKVSKNYILICINEEVRSYDFEEDKIYHRYINDYKKYDPLVITNNNHCVINDNNPIVKLIVSSYDRYVRVWDFHEAKILVKIKFSNEGLTGICLWDDEFLFVGGDDTMIKLVNYVKGKVIKKLAAHKRSSLTLQKFNHPKFGECLVSEGWSDDQIKLWVNKTNKI